MRTMIWNDMRFILEYLHAAERLQERHVEYPERLHRIVSLYAQMAKAYDAERFLCEEYNLAEYIDARYAL
jgi:hypothetical protein